ncbi:hypothetical protein [Microvirga thermotolerans]|uniref:HMA domain-containing protein n=1 Tax=Microvirga thermotolerans TaxID=2651334 RepID=A0A5P9JXR5_9HYPH|nr:hypothetical protein [Microvirga thermotolerans]QFU16548.1 hypothetical protein GDR74_10080 [Microvirga thermotolerans]
MRPIPIRDLTCSSCLGFVVQSLQDTDRTIRSGTNLTGRTIDIVPLRFESVPRHALRWAGHPARAGSPSPWGEPMGHVLSKRGFRERNPNPTDRSVPPVRLMGTIIVALLAITMAIFPISVPQAAASAGHRHAAVTSAGPTHDHAAIGGEHGHAGGAASHDDTVSSASADRPQGGQDCAGPVCCSMGTCHAVQDTALPILHSPAGSRLPIAMPGDEQVAGIVVGRLDRPPRTV